MKLTADAKVVLADGKEIGKVSRFVLDPRSKEITHVVVEHGLLEAREFVLPMDQISHMEEDRLVVKEGVTNVEGFSAFQPDYYVDASASQPMTSSTPFISADPGLRMYFYYPPVITGINVTNPLPLSGADEIKVVKEGNHNTPEGTVILQEGAKVFSVDGHYLGDVEKLFVDTKSHKATHFLITKGIFFKESKLIPSDWVETMDEDDVRLTMKEEVLEKLPDYSKEG